MSEPYIKSTTNSAMFDYTWRHYGTSGPTHVPFSDPSRTLSTAYSFDSLSGSRLPNWKSIIRAGGNATTGCTGNRYSHQPGWVAAGVETKTHKALDPDENLEATEFFGLYNPSGLPLGLPSPPPDVDAEVTNRAIRKVVDQINSIRSSVEAGQDFGEIKQSIESVIHPLNSLRRYVLSYFPSVKKLKHRKNKGKHGLKALADTYLEWTFGWKPLASDVADAIVGLQNRSRFQDRASFTAGASASFNGVSSPGNTMTQGLLTLVYDTRSYSKYSIRYKGSVRTGCDSRGLVSVDQALQLDLPHFLPTVWDLLPYSFIADYFVNIGDIISACSVINSDVLWMARTERNSHSLEVSDFKRIPLSGNQAILHPEQRSWCNGGHSIYTRTSFSRSAVPPSSLVPSLRFSLPISSKPWVNMAAIMLSRTVDIVPFSF